MRRFFSLILMFKQPKTTPTIMGDRANIVIEQDSHSFPHPVFFYTHWSGYAIKQTLQDALTAGESRWNDGQYLARIIFCQMIGEDSGTTGFGISTKIGDGERNLICVNIEQNVVRERASSSDHNADAIQQWTFAEFCKLDLDKED